VDRVFWPANRTARLTVRSWNRARR
jgi:hypothetical protein